MITDRLQQIIPQELAHNACADALACAQLHHRSHWAAVVVPCDLPESPTDLYQQAVHTRRRLLWQEKDYLLGIGISASTRHCGAGRYFAIAQDEAQIRSRLSLQRSNDDAPDMPFFIEAAFEDQAAFNSHWGCALAGCRMIVPQRVYWRHHGQDWMFACCEVKVHDQLEDALAALVGPVNERPFLEQQSWPELHLPDFISIVEEAVALLQSASMRKIVLARAVDEQLSSPVDIPQLIENLHEIADPHSTCYAYDLDDRANFIGTSPELLFTLDQQTCSAMALAGSRRRGENQTEDDTLAQELMSSTKERKEHQLVVEHLSAVLSERHGVFEIPNSPTIRRLAKIQHLETNLNCTLNDANAFDLLSSLHPTPAVCGLPVSAAMQFIQRHENLHRGLYTGAIGFHTPTYAQFIVPLRGGIVRGDKARLFAGAGLVETSNPTAEEEETETKLGLMRQVLHG
ncbi:MAG: isochorismate synthase [Planctomycetes bacterium]|nr:isochorismate synthase [Planctomycetota bacterium]